MRRRQLPERPIENKLRRVTVAEAAIYGRMSKGKLYELLNQKIVAAFKDGRTTLVDLNSLDKYQSDLPPYGARSKTATEKPAR